MRENITYDSDNKLDVYEYSSLFEAKKKKFVGLRGMIIMIEETRTRLCVCVRQKLDRHTDRHRSKRPSLLVNVSQLFDVETKKLP